MPIRSDDPSPISCGPNILDIQETAKYTPRHKKEVLINRSEFIDLTAGLVMDTRSCFCSSKEIYDALKGGSDKVMEVARVLYDDESNKDMDFVMPEDYEDPRQ